MNSNTNDLFSTTLLKTLNSIYEDFKLLEKKGNIYIIGFRKDSFDFDIPKEGGDLAIAFPETDIVVIDRNCVKPFTKKYLKETGGWRDEYNNEDYLKGFTAGCNIFSKIMRSQKVNPSQELCN